MIRAGLYPLPVLGCFLPARDAGLRDGQKIMGISVYWEDAAKQVTVKVRDAGSVKTIRYWPRRKYRLDEGHLATPQFEWDEERFKREPAACLRWFGA